jgi:hypothetical protein
VNRYLHRVQYTKAADPDDPFSVESVAYEPVCVRAETAAAALEEVETATDRYRLAAGVTRVITLTLTTADV